MKNEKIESIFLKVIKDKSWRWKRNKFILFIYFESW